MKLSTITWVMLGLAGLAPLLAVLLIFLAT